MAIRPCKECGKDVSTRATSCPHCGAPVSQQKNGCLPVLGIGVCVVVGAVWLFNIDDAGPPPGPSCKSDWKLCADNSALMNEPHWSLTISSKCKAAANERARFGSPTWPWLPFSTFNGGRGYIDTGLAIAIEPDGQIQNQFGAMVHSRVECTFDLGSQSVSDIEVQER